MVRPRYELEGQERLSPAGVKWRLHGSICPYGYRKDEQNKNKLVPDERTAAVVQRIFRLAVKGYSPYKIGRLLRDDQILTPRAHLAE